MSRGTDMDDALNTLMINLKNFNWETNIQYKIDKNEGKKIVEALKSIKGNEPSRCPHCFKIIKGVENDG